MGNNSSKNNDELVDALVNNQSINTKAVEQVFRLVDRGRFFPALHLGEAYKDAPFKIPDSEAEAWTPGRLHISAPSIYATVLEKLELRPGHSFLNIGSGSGWLNTVVGFLVGCEGINHGVEIHENLWKYSQHKLVETLNSAELAPFGFAVPMLVHGNGLAQQIPDGLPRYDRIYCGAAVTSPKSIDRLVRMLEITGRLIAPVNGALMCYRRTGETRYLAQRLTSCQFADLIRPQKEDKKNILPKIEKPDTLQRICREYIRSLIREDLWSKMSPKMRSICTKDRAEPSSSGYFILNGEQQGNVVAFGNFARIAARVVIPNAEDPGWLENMGEEIMLRDDEDNTRVQVHDLRNDDDDDDVDVNQQIVPPPPPRLDMRRRILADFRFADRAIEDELLGQVNLQFLRREPHPEAGDANENDRFNDRDEDSNEQEVEAVVNIGIVHQERDRASGSESEEGNSEDEADAEIEEVMRPNRPPPLDRPDIEQPDHEALFREHRRVTRQHMQVIRHFNRRRHVDDSDSDEDLPGPVLPQYIYDESGNKRRRIEQEDQRPETKDERQIRIQHETIEKFREIFNQRIDTFPVPVHMSNYLKHANGCV